MKVYASIIYWLFDLKSKENYKKKKLMDVMTIFNIISSAKFQDKCSNI